MPPPIAAPRDVPFPGRISLAVDASDIAHRLFTAHETIPVSPGPLTLLYPEWVPGDHAGVGPIQRIAGLTFSASGKLIPWHRDSVNIFAFHLEIPANVHSLEVTFDYLAAVGPGTGRIEFTPHMLDLAWNTVLLYPAGYFSRQIRIAPSLTLPSGWHFASSLETSTQNKDTIQFQETPLNTLVDSPVAAGLFFNRMALSPDSTAPVSLDIFADEARYLKVDPAPLEAHKRLITEARKLFGAHHFKHYDFLLMLSNSIGGQGLEHHQSSEDVTEADYFTNWPAQTPKNDLLAHEFVHSWNGKFRRPDTLWTANFNTPMRDELLWVYEGLTQYWGYQLAARSGMRSTETTRDLIAALAAGMQGNTGRQWRTVEDTGNQPILGAHGASSWPSETRQSDYYMEGVLLWLNVDMRIRQLSHNTKSLDDFAKLFCGTDDGSLITQTYNLADIVQLLNRVQPYDWQHFLQTRVYEVQPQAPEEGLTLGGYRLIYNDTMPLWMADAKPAYIPGQNVAALGFTGNGSYATSLGFSITPTATLSHIWWNTPAFTAGLLPGDQLLEVNGEAYTEARLCQAILNAETDPHPIRLLLKSGTQETQRDISYRGGLRYPHLERLPKAVDRLTTAFSATSKP